MATKKATTAVLELYEPDYYVDDNFDIIVEVPSGWIISEETKDGELKEAFVTDVDGDWQGVNGFHKEQYEDILENFEREVEAGILIQYVSTIVELIKDKKIKLLKLGGKPIGIPLIAERLHWIDNHHYNYYKGVLATDHKDNRVSVYTFMCCSPVSSNRQLVLDMCEIKKC